MRATEFIEKLSQKAGLQSSEKSIVAKAIESVIGKKVDNVRNMYSYKNYLYAIQKSIERLSWSVSQKTASHIHTTL